MPSLSSIPEPTQPRLVEPDAPVTPLMPMAQRADDDNDNQGRGPADHDAPQQQIDSVSTLLLLLIAGGLLRGVLGLLGPMQGIRDETLYFVTERGKAAAQGSPADAYPLFDLMTLGLVNTGAPGWLAVVVGSLLTLLAVPAAYIVGTTLVGRRLAGVLAAAVMAVHPAVLAWSNALEGTALATGLITIGLALLCLTAKRGSGYALGGGVLLGLAALTAPLAWVVGALAVPLAAKQALKQGRSQAFSAAFVVALLALVPAAGFRAVMFGQDRAALLPEFTTQADAPQMPPIEHALITMTDPSLTELGEAMHLPLGNAGRLTVAQDGAPVPDDRRDVVADTLADAWLLLNAALAGLAAVSIGVMLMRRRFIEVMLLAVPLAAMSVSSMAPGEALRLPLTALVGVLAAGLFATRAEPRLTEEQREAKRVAKLAKQEAKQEARQQRELEKHRDGLYSFDKPKRSERKQPAEPVEPLDLVTEQPDDEPTIPARPI